ncbi:MAG TPA: malate dehydrogenase, partial [Clostridiales bacterium]|nr:malate dehydrogenase [Clostridiales bacterium]
MKRVKIDDLKEFSVRSLEKVGVNKQNAETVAEVLVATDEFGVLTHGTKNLCQYVQKILA